MEAQIIKPQTTNLKYQFLIAGALFIVTLLLFLPARHFQFLNVDDPQYVTRNDRVLQGLSWENVRWAFTTLSVANYQPLAWLSHMLDVTLYGSDPAGHHVSSVLLHAVNAALLYLVLIALTHQPWRCGIVAAIWAVHPLRMESVAWVSERKDVLCAMFFFLAILCYARYARARRDRRGERWAWYAGVAVAFVLGLMAKAMVITLPAVLLLVDYWPLKRFTVSPSNRPDRLKTLLLEKVPLLAIAAGSAMLTYVAQKHAGAMAAKEPIRLSLRLPNALLSYGRYIKKTFLPDDLAAFYPYQGLLAGTSFPWAKFTVAAACVVAFTIFAIFMWRRGERAVLVGWLWFVGMLIPVIGIVQVGMQAMADRYTYLPQIGLLIAIVWGVAAFVACRPVLRLTAKSVACVFAGTLAISTMFQLPYWHDSYSLFQHALQVTDHNMMANMCVAMSLTNRPDRTDEAIRYYQAALKIDPNSAEAHSNLGGLLRDRGDLNGALHHLAYAGNLAPGNFEVRHNLANALADAGRTDDALHQFEIALKLNPDSAQAWFNYAVTLATAGRFTDGVPAFEHALHLRPSFVDARYNYALALAEVGRTEEAKHQFEAVLQVRPGWTEAMGRFAWVLATSPRARDPQAALALAQHANELTLSDQPQLLDVLAAALASAGRFDDAVAAAERGKILAAARGQEELAKRIETHLALYRSGKPFVATTQPMTPATTQTKD